MGALATSGFYSLMLGEYKKSQTVSLVVRHDVGY